MFNKIASIVAAAAFSFGAAAPANAHHGPIPPNNYQDHVELARATYNTGVRISVNPSECLDGGGFMGYYDGWNRLIVVCQQNGRGDGREVEWTAEDYDTLRHEVQHRIQDCVQGEISDHVLANVYTAPVDLALHVLGQDRSNRIVEAYAMHGADYNTIRLELEAFAVAAQNDIKDQLGDLKAYCEY